METPDPQTVVITVTRPALKNQLLSNLVAIPIVPEGSIGQQKDQPVGSGPFKFVNFDTSQNIVELAGNSEYWEGAPKVEKLRVKTVTDANALQAELQTGGVDLAPNPSNLPPDSVRSLGSSPTLKVEQSDGSNIQYLVFNTQSEPLNKTKIRAGDRLCHRPAKDRFGTAVRSGKVAQFHSASAIVGLHAGNRI